MADRTNYIIMLANSMMIELKIPRTRIGISNNSQRIYDRVCEYCPETKGKIISHALAWGYTDDKTNPVRSTSPYDVPPNDLQTVWGRDGNYVLNAYATRTLMAAMTDLVSAKQS